jgi:hypothetical protein
VMRRCDAFNLVVRSVMLGLATRWLLARFGILR